MYIYKIVSMVGEQPYLLNSFIFTWTNSYVERKY